MRVLLTVHCFPPSHQRGAELYTYHVAQSLGRRGHQIHLLYAEKGASLGKEERLLNDVPCTIIKKPLLRDSEDLYLKGDAAIDAIFGELVRSFRPDIVHVNHLLFLSANIPRLSRAQGIAVVFTLHDYWLSCARVNLLRNGESLCEGPSPSKCAHCCRTLYTRLPRWPIAQPTLVHHVKQSIKELLYQTVEKRIAAGQFRRRARVLEAVVRNTDLFIAPSRFLFEFMVRHGVPREKLVYCDYGTATELFSSCSKVARGSRLRFGYLGTISYHKGISVLLEAFDGLHDAELYIYGSGREEVLRPYSHVLAQENVHYEGELLEKDKAGAFSKLDALIVPSVWYENSPLVIHEAFLAGLPIITSNIGGMAELVSDRVNGLHFQAGDPIDLRRKLAELCSTPARLAQMACNLPRVKSMEEHTQELIGYYKRALSGEVSAHGDVVPCREMVCGEAPTR